ncbi:MAG: M28 family peptidase [Flavobacteriales bacterium]|nr:M28 family peptidase [Flavobacteriales bacterium]
MNTRLATLALLVVPAFAHAQLLSDADATDQMRFDVKYLASDLLEGREAGTSGEKMAVDYIAAKFGNVGLMPYGDNATYLQPFHFQAEPRLGELNTLQIGRKKIPQGDAWFPMAFSGNGAVRGKLLKVGYGIIAPDLHFADYPDSADFKDKVVAISVSSPDGIHPHSKYLAYHDLQARAQQAADHGAAAVLFYNDDPTASSPEPRFSAKVKALSVPVIFLTGDLHEEVVLDNNPIALNVTIVREERTAYNVVGMIDNGAANVVVIGAHLDHLGWGAEGSLYRGEPAIHNGADDNASGIAVMLQLARDLAETDHARANDYLFIAFSGEEKGLYGSNYWTKHPTVPIAELNYMINLDMVGRLDSVNSIGINGVGTSPAWDEVNRTLVGTMKVKTSASGIGPSDHTSFYLQGVPAIHFFTGSHSDYHKPSDDEEKVNYDGMLKIARFIESLVATLNDDGKLVFTKTEEANAEDAPRFKVTLGVVPDYMYDGKGMRIDGITEGKPAANAGLKVGDVVVKLGALDVTDMMSYMKGLAQFEKGETTTVRVLRDGKEVDTEITF